MKNKNVKRKDSAYWQRVEKHLAECIVTPIMAIQVRTGAVEELHGNDRFELVGMKRGHLPQCEMCEKKDITYIYFLKEKKNGNVLKIGSTCAAQFFAADLLEGMRKIFDERYGSKVNEIEFEKEIADLRQVCTWYAKPENKYMNRYNPQMYKVLVAAGLYPERSEIHSGDPSAALGWLTKGKRPNKAYRAVIEVWQRHLQEYEGFKKYYDEHRTEVDNGLAAADAFGKFCRMIWWSMPREQRESVPQQLALAV